MSKAKKGGAKLTRTETVTVRLDPKLRYLAELASRKQRRTLSSYIEWAIERSLKNDCIHDSHDNETFLDAANRLWDVNEIDRFILLAKSFPDLLTHDEQLLWKLICTTQTLNFAGTGYLHFRHPSNGKLDTYLIHTCWQELKGVVDGSISEDALKKAMIDDIPF